MADAIAHVRPGQRPGGATGRVWLLARIAVCSTGFRCGLLYRVAHLGRFRMGFIGRIVAAILCWLIRHGYGCTLSPKARIEGGLILPHPHGIVIGPDVAIGPRAWVFHNVTIGGAPGKTGRPTIGRDARIYPGAVISGPIQLGDDVVIGANVVITRDVADGAVVRAPDPVIHSLYEERIRERV